MKRGFALLFLIILLPSAYAAISIEGLDKTEYNLGDAVIVNGYATAADDFNGFIGITLKCGGRKFETPSVSVSLKKGEKTVFNDLNLPRISIPNSVNPSPCNIELYLLESSVVESASSINFDVKKNLKGEFSLDANKLQLGKTIKLNGNVYKLDGTNVQGAAEIYFSGNGTKFLVDSVDIKDSNLRYSYKAAKIPDGDYNIIVLARDVYGNEDSFDAADFTLVSEMQLVIELNKNEFKPGEGLKIKGDVKSPLGSSVLDGDASIKINGDKYDVKIKNSEFKQDVKLADNIKSGKHTIRVYAQDKNGNSKGAESNFYIIPMQKEIIASISKENFKPNETVNIIPSIYDQAGDLIIDHISVEVRDAKKKLVLTDAVKSNSTLSFALDNYAIPGKYKVKISSSKLSSKYLFDVDIAKDFDITVNGWKLLIKNLGNAKLKDEVRIVLNPGNININKDVSIKPGEAGEIDLSREIGLSGTYDAEVMIGSEAKKFSSINITANKRMDLTVVYYILAGIFFIFVVYLSYLRLSSARKKQAWDVHESMQAKRKLKELKESKEKKGHKEHNYRYSYKNIDKEQAASDFKHSYIDKTKEPDHKEGVFNMFDK